MLRAAKIPVNELSMRSIKGGFVLQQNVLLLKRKPHVQSNMAYFTNSPSENIPSDP